MIGTLSESQIDTDVLNAFILEWWYVNEINFKQEQRTTQECKHPSKHTS